MLDKDILIVLDVETTNIYEYDDNGCEEVNLPQWCSTQCNPVALLEELEDLFRHLAVGW